MKETDEILESIRLEMTSLIADLNLNAQRLHHIIMLINNAKEHNACDFLDSLLLAKLRVYASALNEIKKKIISEETELNKKFGQS